MTSSRFFAIALLLLPFAAGAVRAQASRDSAELSKDYYRKWLKEDVIYIITEEEREVFLKLTNDEERDLFIEQFWARRDTDPSTRINEFQEEHYRRIAYSNQRYHSGEPGWKTDRGEIYIKFGPPSMVESYPTGGSMTRRMSEGGGRTTFHPFERWRYNHIEGAGSNIEIEFVDASRTGEYRIALSPQEKDALLMVPGVGLTEAEERGIEGRWLRITRDYGLGIQARSPVYAMQPDDFPFQKLVRLAELQKAPTSVRFRDLREKVRARISFSDLPLAANFSYVKASSRQFIVPITVQIRNKDLSYKLNGEAYEARVQVFGKVTDLSNRIWLEFDHELVNQSASRDVEGMKGKLSLFQKVAHLPAGRYRLEIYASDTGSGRMGFHDGLLVLPGSDDNTLDLSPPILANLIERQDISGERFEQFNIGGFKVVPNVRQQFTRQDVLYIYLQAYNVKLDTNSGRPALQARYFLMKGNELVESFPDTEGRSIQYVSPNRIVLATGFRLAEMTTGDYRVLVRVTDSISGSKAETRATFNLNAAQEREPD